MIDSGWYKFRNVLYNTQYADLADGNPADGTIVMGHEEDKTPAGIDHRTFYVDVLSAVEARVTIKNKTSGTYVTINETTDKVEGNHKAQELQLSTEGGGEYVIHPMNVNNVWVLNEPADWTQITATPAPPPTVEDYRKKYWKLEPVK
ncbi:hypothetical protein DFH29DRAFT_1003627 [Suillus ampliporus]|nr:hypothetical protein DFH29DRAFT_1003627 [Suillus ampliporus]